MLSMSATSTGCEHGAEGDVVWVSGTPWPKTRPYFLAVGGIAVVSDVLAIPSTPIGELMGGVR